MFEFDKPKNTTPQKSSALTMYECVSSLYEINILAELAFSEKVGQYRKLMEQTLARNGNVYDDSVKSILTEASKDSTGQLISDLENLISQFKGVKSSLQSTMSEMAKGNIQVVQKYQPLLKKLNTQGISYAVPKYTLDALPTSQMMKRLSIFINEGLKLTGKVSNTPPQLDANVEAVYRDIDSMNIEMARAILGVAKTINVKGNFHQLAMDAMVTTDNVTHYFSDDVFNELLSVTASFDPVEIDVMTTELTNEIATLKELKKHLLDAGDEFNKSTLTSLYALRKTVIMAGLCLVLEVIELRVELMRAKSENYRKVIVNTYDNLVTPGSKPMQESYKPAEDDVIGYLYTECVVDSQVLE